MSSQWKNLSDEEKGKLLLAHHRGEAIYNYDPLAHTWVLNPSPTWNDEVFYRDPDASYEVILYYKTYADAPPIKAAVATVVARKLDLSTIREYRTKDSNND
jgi:hypothetical protein